MKRLIICKFCHENLEDPIILPCGKTICSKHLLNETNNFKCGLCDDSHDKTVDKFPINEELNQLLEICDNYVDLNSIDLGPEYKLAKQKLKHLNDSIRESELLIKDPAFYIDDYFTKLRNEVDLSKEQLIEDIELKYEKIINELKEIESKCKQNIQNKELDEKLDIAIKLAKKYLNESTETFESNLKRGDCCNEISLNTRVLISGLKYRMNKCQVDLLGNKEFKFNSISTKDSIFGDLITNDAEIIDESRLEGTMRFEIKEFKKFRFTFNKFRLIDQWFLVKNIGVMMKIIDYDIYLEVLYKPLGITKQILELNPIKTDVSINMIKTNGESYGQKIFHGKFNKDAFVKIAKIVSLKDIMTPTNSLFNEKTDSVTIEAKIGITD